MKSVSQVLGRLELRASFNACPGRIGWADDFNTFSGLIENEVNDPVRRDFTFNGRPCCFPSFTKVFLEQLVDVRDQSPSCFRTKHV